VSTHALTKRYTDFFGIKCIKPLPSQLVVCCTDKGGWAAGSLSKAFMDWGSVSSAEVITTPATGHSRTFGWEPYPNSVEDSAHNPYMLQLELASCQLPYQNLDSHPCGAIRRWLSLLNFCRLIGFTICQLTVTTHSKTIYTYKYLWDILTMEPLVQGSRPISQIFQLTRRLELINCN
jgi:hypothetical protein